MHLDQAVAALSRPGRPARVVEQPLPGLTRRLRILVADDSATDRQIALALLRRLGLSADLVADGLEAAAMAREKPYDVILMDVSMPVLDGITATRQIKEDMPAAAPRIFAMTGGRAATPKACEDAGMAGYLAKPVRLERLAAVLAACRDAQQP